MREAIGGYLSLELHSNFQPYHQGENCIALNTARNCLEYILKVRKYTKVYIPFFTCDVILEPFNRLGIKFEFYSIDFQLDPIFDFSKLEEHEGFLYTNYFGLKDEKVLELSKLNCNLIVDNAQSFFSKPLIGIDTFYSARKFIGVSDGAYLYCDSKLRDKLEIDSSFERMAHLLIRLDKSAEEGYLCFSQNDTGLVQQPIKQMSKLTDHLLRSVDYQDIINKRKRNYALLHRELEQQNSLNFVLEQNQVPMVYPFLVEDSSLKNRLLGKRIYCPTYWPNVLEWSQKDSLEFHYSKRIIHLPIDQRYDEKDMEYIINIIKK